MTRSDAIFSPLMGMLAFSGLAYVNYINARQSGLSMADAVTTFPVIVAAFLVPIRLVEIWSILSQPGKEELLDPKRDVTIEEKRVAKVLSICFLAAIIFVSVWQWPGFAGWTRPFNSPLWNLAGLVFGTYLVVSRLFTPRFRVLLSVEGMQHNQLRPSALRWTDVADVSFKTLLETSTITIVLRSEREFRRRSLLSRWQRLSSFSLNPSAFGADPEAFFQAIELRRAASILS